MTDAVAVLRADWFFLAKSLAQAPVASQVCCRPMVMACLAQAQCGRVSRVCRPYEREYACNVDMSVATWKKDKESQRDIRLLVAGVAQQTVVG